MGTNHQDPISNMDWDGLADHQSQHLHAGFLRLLDRESPALPLRLAAKHRPDKEPPVEASEFMTGSYNICTIVTFKDGYKVIVRFPILGRSRFRVEKADDEAMLMNYLSRRTPKIPVPPILDAGLWGCGPYIVTEYIEGVLLSKCLRDPTTETPSLRPDVSDDELRRAYHGMAGVLLDLYQYEFPRIGNVASRDGVWKVAKRPITLNMNELVRGGNFPPSEFDADSFPNASLYFEELARQQFLHLKYQRNNAITDENDCKTKYIARCLFRRIAREVPTKPPPYRLHCDDFRPSNVIVASESDFTIKAVIDWEYTYIAPVEFSHAAPWWLLFESPEAWEADLDKLLDRYKPRLKLFLEVMEGIEDNRIGQGALKESQRLSGHMARSLDNGTFWVCLAARKSYMFDDIYWAFLDEKFFGTFTSLDDRLPLLTQDERDGMDEFVQMKLQQASEKRLDEHMSTSEIIDL